MELGLSLHKSICIEPKTHFFTRTSVSRMPKFMAPSWAPILNHTSSLRLQPLPPSAVSMDSSRLENERLDLSKTLTLDSIRESLIRQEDSIIYNLIERAQYSYNAPTYDPESFQLPGFNGSLVEYMLKETEVLHSKVGRYKSPDEQPFFPNDLPEPLLPPLNYPQVLHPAAASININDTIWKMYYDELLPRFAAEGDDGNYGSAALCDALSLQALSKRIHYGKFVAEAKFRDSPQEYTPAIRAQDKDALMKILTFEAVEAMVLRRVEQKAMVFGQEVSLDGKGSEAVYKIKPSVVARLYGEWVMPLTKQVQVEYLLRRLD
ncbi:hypothetical protein AMTRI_Chr12g273110 [Amborella trichopoda]|nr:chorismate mutase 1, chloroplastic [Amborella trichopoda]|eukprot:XP_006857227.2 chorismate mutase 1, chloroplastic [Amborella trichopoda]